MKNKRCNYKNKKGLVIKIIGDSGPFSVIGRSIGYQIIYKDVSILIDIGAPIFNLMSIDEIKEIDGIIGTHSHEDHKRWFTDTALFYFYMNKSQSKLNLYSTEEILDEFRKTSKAALERSLNFYSNKVVDLPYINFVKENPIGPTPKYKIVYDYKYSKTKFDINVKIVDNKGKDVPATKAKLVFNDNIKTRPRMIVKDSETGLWVEPETYYDFSETEFYSNDDNSLIYKDVNLKISPFKAPTWHGIPTIGVKIENKTDTVFFSSDTVYDPELWKKLSTEIIKPKYNLNHNRFRNEKVILGDINDYIMKIWSNTRYETALNTYTEDSTVIHDVANPNSIVHSDYNKVIDINCKNLLLTHAPDNFVSKYPIVRSGKVYEIYKNEVYELINNKRKKLNADIYIKKGLKNYVGYKNPNGNFKIIQNDNDYLELLARNKKSNQKYTDIVSLYEDINGEYYSYICSKYEDYIVRPDKKVENIKFSTNGSKGKIVNDLREFLKL